MVPAHCNDGGSIDVSDCTKPIHSLCSKAISLMKGSFHSRNEMFVVACGEQKASLSDELMLVFNSSWRGAFQSTFLRSCEVYRVLAFHALSAEHLVVHSAANV